MGLRHVPSGNVTNRESRFSRLALIDQVFLGNWLT